MFYLNRKRCGNFVVLGYCSSNSKNHVKICKTYLSMLNLKKSVIMSKSVSCKVLSPHKQKFIFKKLCFLSLRCKLKDF